MTDNVSGDSPIPTDSGRGARRLLLGLIGAAIIAVAIAASLRPSTADLPGDAGADLRVTSDGRFEVTARLVELPGDFLPNDGLYNYAFVLKYEVIRVHRGDIAAGTIHVAHYNPRKPRSRVADEFYPDLGGTVTGFRAGDTHRLALDAPWDEHYIGPLVDRYHQLSDKTLYWSIRCNAAHPAGSPQGG